MKDAIARSSRAIAPLSTTKREPDSLAAVSKSISPKSSPSSKCCFGSNAYVFGSPHVRTSILSLSSLPGGTSSSGALGSVESASRKRASISRSCSSPDWIISLASATSAISFCAVSSSPDALALPMSLDAELRLACASCNCCTSARRSSSILRIFLASGPSPRLASAASKPSGSSRIHLRSCTEFNAPVDVESGDLNLGHPIHASACKRPAMRQTVSPASSSSSSSSFCSLRFFSTSWTERMDSS